MTMLDPGASLPELKGYTVNHGLLELPKSIDPARWAIVLAYRAHW